MVLQRDVAPVIWGWGAKGADVTVALDGDNKGTGDVTIFRVTVRATGTSADSAEVILRTQYGRIF